MRTWFSHRFFRRWIAAALMLGVALDATANPTGMTVQSGSATATSSGSHLTVTTTSQNTFLNWRSFNIAAIETTTFQEPSTASIVWNQINNSANPSQIYGSLQANGVVVLLNSSGFYFGPNSFVSTAGLVVSTANCIPAQNSGGSWEFNGPPPLASIVNYGHIKIGNGGSAFLIADKIENYGDIEAPGGSVGLAAGQTVMLSERPDGRGMSMQVTLPGGSVDNEGRLIADGGTIAMRARVVNQNGFIQANSVRNQNGVIELVASDQLTLGANSQITASGDNSPAGSAGGKVTLQSANNFSDSVGSQITVTGGTQGGNGGNVEISAPNVQSLNSSINARAQTGWTAGKLLLDPDYIILDTSGSDTISSGTVRAGDDPNGTGTLDLNVNTAFANLAVSQIILQAAYDITLAGNTSWDLSGTIGANFGGVTGGQLTLEAGRNITFGDGSKITDANNWSVALDAGYNFANNTVQSGYGNIYLNGGSGQSGSGSIQLSQGSINLTAGNSIVVGSGCQLIDDGGVIGLYAQTVDQNGLIQANSVGNQHGVIELVASDLLTLGANSVIQANGDNSPDGSAGGQIMLQTAQTFSDDPDSQIQARGGANGGDGGKVLIYAASANSKLDVSAQAGSTAGNTYYYTRLGNDGLGDWTLTASLLASFAGFSHILFQANDDITIAAGQTLNLGAGSGQLTIAAGGDITFGDGSSISDANSWSVTLKAGVGFPSEVVQSGSGSIYLTGGQINGVTQTTGGSIQTAGGFINLEAGQDIQAGSGSLMDNNGYNFAIESGSGSMTLSAGRDILADLGTIATLGGGGITATAGRNIQVGFGSIATLDGGDISVTAGQDIQVGSGSITTVRGGNITATATAGSVNTGTGNGGYIFNGVSASDTTDPKYQLVTVDNPYPGVLGGISTAAGGNVKITAGLDIISLLPQGSESTPTDAGSGAFGPEPGNVTLTAGRNVVGHYVVANGTGIIKAGVNAGTTADDPGYTDGDPEPTPQEELALSLITGSWSVQATHDINLQEVRNPNGIFNEAGNATYKSYHLFDYWTGDAATPCDSVTLNAVNSVQLLGDNVPRNSDESPAVPIIYPPTLDITAGAGGVVLGADVILFPSAKGSLNITTTGGGSFESQAYVGYLADLARYANGELDSPPPFPDEAQIIMSDSTRTHYIQGVYAFGASDHAATPVHFGAPTTVAFNISGDMDNIELVVPEAAQINVVGNMNNCGFIGQNLTKGDVTTVNVGAVAKAKMESSGLLDLNTDSGIQAGGDIQNQSAYSSVPVASAPDLSLLNQAYINGRLTPLTDLYSRLQYNPTTGLLTFQGRMSPAYEGYLTSLTCQVFRNGQPVFNADGTPELTTVSILGSTDTATGQTRAQELYDACLSAPSGQNPGYYIGGGGQFNINARNMNLGSTLGIRSVGPEENGALASTCHFTQGADINLTLSGYLDIFSTTICALNAGNITIDAADYVNVGLTSLTGNDQYVRGIFTVGPGNVSVVAGGNINVNGSRIAAYDGGSVFVESSGGNVDAGSGSSGSVSVEEIYVDPNTYLVYRFSPIIPLSGILAMTFPPRSSFFPAPAYNVGNILVETPNGNITAHAAGIVQLPLNGGDSTIQPPTLCISATQNGGGSSDATVVLLAGEDINGNIISPGRNIDLGGSAVVGSDVTLKASGNIKGVVFARNNANVSAQQNVNVTVLAEGTANVSGGGDVSGTIIGVGGVSASGGSVEAALLSNNGVSGSTSGESGMAPGTAANAASQGMASNSTNPAKNADTTAADDDEKKKKGKIALAQKTGRVTVFLAPRQQSKAQNLEPRT
jgi:filamentous hemagglutinin family protein